MKKAILYGGGVLNLALAAGHCFFWTLFNWPAELQGILPVSRGILQVGNVIIIFIILYFAVISFMMARRGTRDFFARSIIILIAGFYALRLALGYPFFGFHAGELFVWIVCALIIAGYGSLLFAREKG